MRERNGGRELTRYSVYVSISRAQLWAPRSKNQKISLLCKLLEYQLLDASDYTNEVEIE